MTQVRDSHSQKRDLTISNVLTLKERAYTFLNLYHDLKPKHLCQMLQVPYGEYKDYVRQLRCKWKRDFKIGLPSKCPKSQHNVRAYCKVPECVDRGAALEAGWIPSKNKNRVLIFKDAQYGRIEWWETRLCMVHINRPQTLGRVKQFLSNAFFKSGLIFDINVFHPFIESVWWFGAHDVYVTAEKLPYKVIDTYKESLGFTLKCGDLSHQNAIEVEWARPSWMEKAELFNRQVFQELSTLTQDAIRNAEANGRIVEVDARALQQTSQTIAQFNDFMKDLSAPKRETKNVKDPSIV